MREPEEASAVTGADRETRKRAIERELGALPPAYWNLGAADGPIEVDDFIHIFGWSENRYLDIRQEGVTQVRAVAVCFLLARTSSCAERPRMEISSFGTDRVIRQAGRCSSWTPVPET